MINNQLPFSLIWGVDVAMKKLRPNAAYTLSNREFIDYQDPDNLPPPTWEEIQTQIEQDKSQAEKYIEQNLQI